MTKTTSFLYALILSVIVFVSGGASVDAHAVQVRAPVVTDNLFDESIPLLYTSALVYDFSDLIKAVRNSKITLEIPEGFPINLKDFLDKSVDLRYLNDGNGLCFHDMIKVIELNKENIGKLYEKDDSKSHFVTKILDHVKDFQSIGAGDRQGDFYLATYRSIQADISCVYSVIKDTYNKRIIITFRGSQPPNFSTRDWRTNVNANLADMKTPSLIKDKMEGKMKKRILVHRGFYEYLFDNKRIAREQRYDRIVDDIRSPLMEKGYSVYVTGHSLGGALSQLFSFELAGEGVNSDWMPKPITCISYAAPPSGTSGYRTAIEQEEKDGLLRMLRVNNEEDVVPTIPNFSWGWKKRTMKHVGINLRLTKKSYSIIHTTMVGTWNALQNSILKPVLNAMKWHGLELHEERMFRNIEDLRAITIDGLYKDKAVVSKDFIEAKNIQHDEDKEEL